jgi:small redox-active disulfide protein 2
MGVNAHADQLFRDRNAFGGGPVRSIRVLGADSAECRQLETNVHRAVGDLAIEVCVDRVTDMDVITMYGVMMTPALVVDGELKAAGRVLPTEEIKGLLAGHTANG